MRTYLTRLTFCAAGAVLTGIGTAAAAYASDEDLTVIDESPIYVDEHQTLQPPDKCEIEFTIEDCGLPVDGQDGLQPQFPDDAELIDPGALDGTDSGDDTSEHPEGGATEDPESGTAEDPEDGESEEPSDAESESSEGGAPEDPATEPGTTGDESGSGDGGQDAPSEPSGSSGAGGGDSASDPSGDAVSDGTADEPTPGADETTITPTVQSTSSDTGGTPGLPVAVLAAALAVFGTGMVGLGFVRRSQPARGRWR